MGERHRSESRARCVVRLAALVVLAGCSSSPGTSPSCNTCDGNVAVSCGYNCHLEQYTNPQRTDCGAMKCAVDTSTLDCTDQGSAWLQQVSVAECK